MHVSTFVDRAWRYLQDKILLSFTFTKCPEVEWEILLAVVLIMRAINNRSF